MGHLTCIICRGYSVNGKSREDPQHTINEYEMACDRTSLKISVGKSKVLVVSKDQRTNCGKLKVKAEVMEELGKKWINIQLEHDF